MSPRNFTLNTIKALGPLLTGFTPVFHNINHTNNFAEGINILSNPIEKGLELLWPDTTLGQLANLEDQSLRDNAITRTVVKNNTQVRFVVFVPKDLINDPAKRCENNRQEKVKCDKAWRDKPLEVMKHLGRMILVGDQVNHINRVRVVSEAERTVGFTIAGRVTDPCLAGVEDVTITLTQGSGFSLTTKTDKDGKYSFDNVPSGVSYTVTPSQTDTTFKTPSGNSFTLQGNRSDVDFSIESSPMTIGGTITDADDNPLQGIKVELTAESGTFKKRTAETDEKGNYTFTDVPGGVVYVITPVSDKTFDNKSLKVPNLNCIDQTFDFKEKPKEK